MKPNFPFTFADSDHFLSVEPRGVPFVSIDRACEAIGIRLVDALAFQKNKGFPIEYAHDPISGASRPCVPVVFAEQAFKGVREKGMSHESLARLSTYQKYFHVAAYRAWMLAVTDETGRFSGHPGAARERNGRLLRYCIECCATTGLTANQHDPATLQQELEKAIGVSLNYASSTQLRQAIRILGNKCKEGALNRPCDAGTEKRNQLITQYLLQSKPSIDEQGKSDIIAFFLEEEIESSTRETNVVDIRSRSILRPT